MSHTSDPARFTRPPVTPVLIGNRTRTPGAAAPAALAGVKTSPFRQHAGKVVHTIKVGQRPWGLALSPDGKKLFVANGPSDDVSVIDVPAAKEVGRVRAGRSPWGVAVAPAPD